MIIQDGNLCSSPDIAVVVLSVLDLSHSKVLFLLFLVVYEEETSALVIHSWVFEPKSLSSLHEPQLFALGLPLILLHLTLLVPLSQGQFLIKIEEILIRNFIILIFLIISMHEVLPFPLALFFWRLLVY